MAKSSTQTFYGTNNRKNQTHKTRRQVVEELLMNGSIKITMELSRKMLTDNRL
nr:hypothetical protein [Limosilactobacillus reuteri]